MNSQLNRLFILMIVFLTAVSLLTGGCRPVAPTQPPPTSTLGPLDLVKTYEEAFNSHDVDAVMALLSDNVSINLADTTDQARSKQESHDLVEYWFAMNVEFHYNDCKTTGSIVGCKAVGSSDCSKAAGMSGVNISAASFIFNNGTINQIVLQMQPDDENTFFSFLNNMEQWANKVHPEEMLKIYPTPGTTVNNRETGTIYSGLCKEYAAINH